MSSNPDMLSESASHQTRDTDRAVFAYEILEAMGKISFIPVIALPALIGLTPLGNSLLFNALSGILLLTAGFQLLVGHAYIQLPNRFAYMQLRGRLAQYFISKLLDMVEWLNEAPKPQLLWLTSGAFASLPYFVLVCVGLILPVMAILGQSSFLIYTAALIYCVSLITRDGRYTLASAFILSFASIAPIFQLAS